MKKILLITAFLIVGCDNKPPEKPPNEEKPDLVSSPKLCGGAKGKLHSNGGGFVADTAEVSETAYIGPEAQVCERAQVYGEARVSDKAKVSGRAKVFGKAQVSDTAQVSGTAKVFGRAQVSGKAQVSIGGYFTGHIQE